ncbi:MAG: MMPL family transporter [Paracoccaceae bacterium]
MRDDMATPWPARWVGAWMEAAAARPRTALACLCALVLLAGWAATGIRVDTDSSRMLDPDLPFQQRAHALNDAFPELKNTIVIAVRGAPVDAVEAQVAALTEALRGGAGIASVFAPSADRFFLENGFLYRDLDTLERELTRLSKSANLLAQLREDRTVGGFLGAIDEARRLAERAEIEPDALEALYEEAAVTFEAAASGQTRPFAWQAAMTGGGEAVLRTVSVRPEFDFARINPARTALETVAAAVAGLPEVAGVEAGVTGEPALRAEELSAVVGRMGLSLGLSMVLVTLVLYGATRTVGGTLTALAALVATLVLTAGLAGAGIGALNLVSVAFVVLMVGLGIDFAIHIIAHLSEVDDATPREAVRRTGQGIGMALALSAATTALAFLAFAVTEFVGMAQLGLIGGAGVIVAFAVAITLIPAAAAIWPGLAGQAGRPRTATPRAGASRVGVWLALAVGLGAAVLATEARFDPDPMGLRNPDAPSVATYAWLLEDRGAQPLRLSLLADTEAEARAAAARLEALPEVAGTVWIERLVPADQDAKLALVDLAWPSIDFAVTGDPVELDGAEPPEAMTLAETLGGDGAGGRLADALRAWSGPGGLDATATAAALFHHFDALIGRLAASLEVAPVTRDGLPDRLVGRYVAEDGRLRVEILPEARIDAPDARRAFVDAVLEAAPAAAGPPAQIEGARRTISAAMLQATGIALAAAAALAFLATRSVALTGAVLVPVALAGAVTMAASVLLGLPFNYANIIVLPLLIGIGVDAGVHLALRAQTAGAVFDTATPRAVAASALTTIGAFATLGLSEHQGTASMGIMLAIALVAAVAMAFALTPPLARLEGRAREP